MSLHIAVPHFHLPHLSRRAIVRSSVGAAAVVLLLAADAVGHTLTAVALLIGAVAAWQVTDRYWRGRHIKAMEGLQEVAHQQRMQIAGFEREQAYWWRADAADRDGRWPALNEAARVGVR